MLDVDSMLRAWNVLIATNTATKNSAFRNKPARCFRKCRILCWLGIAAVYRNLMAFLVALKTTSPPRWYLIQKITANPDYGLSLGKSGRLACANIKRRGSINKSASSATKTTDIVIIPK